MKKGSDLTLMLYTKANDACFVVKPSLVKEQELHKTSHVKRIAGERSIMRTLIYVAVIFYLKLI